MKHSNLTDIPFEKEQVAIAMTKSPLGGGHIGIGFHSVRNGPQVLHLEWHKRLKSDAIPSDLKQCWMAFPLNIPKGASKVMVALTRAVASRGAMINYGINLIAAKGSFGVNGSYKPPKGSDGLTCATFIVELLRAGKIDLVQSHSWRSHEANITWAQSVCDYLANTPSVDADHLDSVRNNINGIRMRPLEVAGAASLDADSWPAGFEEVQKPAQLIENQLESTCLQLVLTAASIHIQN